MFDDTPDKVRRNLLVYCAALLMGWYLGIDAKTLLALASIQLPSIDPFKTTVLSLIVLLYLAMRFAYTKEYKDGGSYLEVLRGVPYSSVHKYLKLAVDDYGKFGRSAKRCGIFDWRGLDFEISQYRTAGSESIVIKMDIAGVNAPGPDRVGVMDVMLSGSRNGVEEVVAWRAVPRHLKYKIPRIAFYRMRVAAAWNMLVNDEKFVTAKFPMILALIAFIYLMGKLFVITFERL